MSRDQFTGAGDHDKPKQRGSQKILAAWKARALTEELVNEIAQAFAKSPATVEGADVVGGTNATGLRLSLQYDGDDVPLVWQRHSFLAEVAPHPRWRCPAAKDHH